MTRKKVGNEGEMKKLLNELSAKEALHVKGGDAPIQDSWVCLPVPFAKPTR